MIQSKSPRSAETTLKSLRKVFAKWGFKITVEAELTQTDFLDIELNLNSKTYLPIKKQILAFYLSPTNLKTVTYNNQQKTKQTTKQPLNMLITNLI